jgi:hypothetical protein
MVIHQINELFYGPFQNKYFLAFAVRKKNNNDKKVIFNKNKILYFY